MNRNTAIWITLLTAWTLVGAAEPDMDADPDLAEDELAAAAEALEGLTEDLADMGIDSVDDMIGPSAFCTSYTDNRRKRRVYLSRIFAVNLADWRNVKEDRPSTDREVMRRFEFEYAAWLGPRYDGIFARQTNCELFSLGGDTAERRMQDIEDFRELGHGVVETDWRPAG